jgi:hypothetical protein
LIRWACKAVGFFPGTLNSIQHATPPLCKNKQSGQPADAPLPLCCRTHTQPSFFAFAIAAFWIAASDLGFIAGLLPPPEHF